MEFGEFREFFHIESGVLFNLLELIQNTTKKGKSITGGKNTKGESSYAFAFGLD
jgi:hypothetical protein